MFDILITGGKVFNGLGHEPATADVGIEGDVIREIGDLSAAETRVRIPANGKCVCPGFIDVHSHSDTYLLIEPQARSKIFQGVTTEVLGNCGASAAPRLGKYQMPFDWREKNYPGTWSTVAEYRALLEQAKPTVNAGLLIGHNTLRAGVVGYEGRTLDPSEVNLMKDRLSQALDEGGAGLSTGLVYPPGIFAPPEEIVELARIVAVREKIYTSHMRSEGRRLLEALDETIQVGRQSGVRVEISHLKTAGRSHWHMVDTALDKIRGARAAGIDVAADRYPYTASSTELDIILPGWAEEGGREKVLGRIRAPEIRARIRSDLQASRDEAGWDAILIGSTRHPDNKRFQGMPLVEVARQLNLEPVDAALHLFETDELYTGAIFFGMSEENMWKILAEPYVMLGSDASVRGPDGPLSFDFPHPRAYGSFPRFLRAALDGKTVTVPEAIRKMTSLPAQQFRLKQRGALAPGMTADVLVFNPDTVRDTATFAQPHQLAVGVETVIVNGVLTIQDGRLSGFRGGRFLG